MLIAPVRIQIRRITIRMLPTDKCNFESERSLTTYIKINGMHKLFFALCILSAFCLHAQLPVKGAPVQQVKNISAKPLIYNFNNTKICLDRGQNISFPARPAAPLIPKIDVNGNIIQINSRKDGLSAVTDYMWNPGDVITVGFYPGASSFVIEKIRQYAHSWENFANISFQFINDVTKAQIRVGFDPTIGSWSYIGRQNLSISGETMNFGWFNDQTPEDEFSRVVLHEFGHALGFIHEHQSPAAGIAWDKEKVYALFGKSPNFWSREEVDKNIFYKYQQSYTNSTSYDKSSIMHYFFSSDLTTDGSLFMDNRVLSPLDKQFSAFVYPYPSNATGLFHTGDDCDEIVFTLEYNVVPKDQVEFILEPGVAPNNQLITWWKRVGIPLKGGGEAGLEMQDGKSETRRILFTLLDPTRGISFSKAKFLGAHTLLNYKWNAMPAFVGGCRIRLKWRRDGC